MSGGVDSSVSALLLQRQGYYVEAVFMQNWQDQTEECNIAQDFGDALAVCQQLKMKLHLVNFAAEYWNKVFSYFLDEYAIGRTPNPDILCNKEIKFKAFLDHAQSMGADFIATGHYTRISNDYLDHTKCLLKGIDNSKDQSYFLYLLNQQQLVKTVFPIGELKKSEVRKIALEAGMVNYLKKDSTGICFIGEKKFKRFLSSYLLSRPGDIVTRTGSIIGKHDGLMFYTIGQRKGIGIGGKQGLAEAPWYVAEKDTTRNQLIVTQDRQDKTLFTRRLICLHPHWISGSRPDLPFNCRAKIRYRQPDEDCTIRIGSSNFELEVEFIRKQWAITPGQSIVFYTGDKCLGGATIENVRQ